MNKNHALSISLVVGAAAIAGTIAATKTVHLGKSAAAQPKAPSTLIAGRTKALDRTEIALRKALKQRPPKLPPLPKAAMAPAAGTSSTVGFSAAARQAQRVVYVRPAPIIRHVHRPGGHETEHEAEGGSQHDGGGGFDD